MSEPRQTRLHEIAHARAGDKGNRSNISLIPYKPDAYPLLLEQVTEARVLELFAHKGASKVTRYELPNLPALNFVIDDALEGGVNAALNIVCLRLLKRHRGEDVNFKASAIFTSNDSIVNMAILASGILVLWLGSNVPDLILGIVSALFAANGGREILEHARKASRKPTAPSSEQNTRSTE